MTVSSAAHGARNGCAIPNTWLASTQAITAAATVFSSCDASVQNTGSWSLSRGDVMYSSVPQSRTGHARVMSEIAGLARSDEERQEHIVAVLVDAFTELIDDDPRAFRRKFRKMAADPFAFYRGSAPLFYADVAGLEDPWVDDATSSVWIQGDLHAENYGTYMDADGRARLRRQRLRRGLPRPLHLGPAAPGGQSLALLGFAKALSDDDRRSR